MDLLSGEKDMTDDERDPMVEALDEWIRLETEAAEKRRKALNELMESIRGRERIAKWKKKQQREKK